jgi:methylase of polypeptide subunit release factors
MPVLDIAVLVLAMLVVASIVWTTLWVGISPMPSSGQACRAMLAAAARSPQGTIVDVGSGWGTLAIRCARAWPERAVIGYELSWVPWLVSMLFKHLLQLHNLELRRQDFLQADLGRADLLLCYLFPRGMQDLAHKLRGEGMHPLVVSNTFALPSFEPDELIQLPDLYRTRIYVYQT